MRTTVLVLFLVAAAGASLGCGVASVERCAVDDALPDVPAPTWQHDVRPIVEGRCVRCHSAGGLAPFALTTSDEVRSHAVAVQRAVVSRTMPPWMPARCCNRFADDPSLTPEQIAIVSSWVELGMPEGEVEDAPPLPPIGGLPRVDLELAMDAPYLPAVDEVDDTRCFLLPWPETERRFVTGFGITPGARAFVHHALVAIAPANMKDSYQSLIDEDDAPGWSCPGGVIVGLSGYLGGWSPGWDGQQTPEGSGHKVEPDDAIVLTIHYSQAHDDTPLDEDQTSVQLMLADDVDHELFAISVFDARWTLGGMPIAKGAERVRYAVEYAPTDVFGGKALTIVGVNLHMHERGAQGMVAVKRKDGATDCLLQIDDYDHAWQGDYLFAEQQTIAPGDLAYVECVFDNSAAHQRIKNGAPEEPRDLNWAEDGEMCVGFITAFVPK